jgi:uncharacterized protein (DUF2062 family)
MTGFALRQRIRGIWHKLSRLDARPDQIAAGFSIGIAASFLPLNPSPIIVASAVAWLSKRSVIAAVAGATVAILYTPLLPAMWWAEYRVGKLILPVQRPLTLDRAQLWEMLKTGRDVYAAMFVGSIIIAAPITLCTYWLIKRLAERWARRRNAQRPSI